MKWQKRLCWLLALILVLTACGASSAAEREDQRLSGLAADRFTDVSAGDEYAAAVGWCLENGLMNGVSDTEFDPNGTLTRAMVATILYRAEQEPAVIGEPAFDDTQAGVWYSNAVVWANGQGLLLGYGNGLFGTGDPVSVEQLEVIMGRYTGNGPEWAGIPEKAAPATRAQAAAAFYAAMKPAEPTPAPTRRPSGGGSSSGGSSSSGGGSGGGSVTPPAPDPDPVPDPGPVPDPAPDPARSNILVAYFSATNNTRPIAEQVAQVTGGDLFEIVPQQPYTAADLNYSTDCRANAEQNDPTARPAIATAVDHMDQYDAVLIGYPIWWGKAPKIIHTFLETYDLRGKTVATFCTSGGSGHEDATLRGYEPDATWLTGKRFTNVSQVEEWVSGLDLPKPQEEETVMDKIVLSFNGHTYTATLADNSSARAFAQLLKSGPLTVSTHDYGSFEKVGALGTDLPRNDEAITTVPGDIILYQGNQITVYYAQNSWTFTRLGKVDDPSGLRDALGDGDVDITFRLAEQEAAAGPFDLAAGRVTLNSGYEMPVAGLGTYSLHGDTCKSAVKSALEQGVRLIDTARMYGNEQEIGEAIRAFMAETGTPREEIFVITKIYPGSDMADPEPAIQGCLDRLDIGYVDMMLLHHPDPNDVKAYQAMEEFVAAGKIRSLGLSNWYIEEIDDFIAQVNIKPALVQNEIHPYYQEKAVIPYMHDLGIVMQAWYPLGGRGHTAELLGNETIVGIAQAHGKSAAQVILRWDLQNGVTVIPGSSNPAHILENISLFDFELTDREMAAIAALDRNEKHDWY